MSSEILLLHGPNLNLLGERETEVYGSQSLEELTDELRNYAAKQEFQLQGFQSNSEGSLIDKLHEVRSSAHGVILNAGAYTHTSVALRDAIAGIEVPVVEVHISNVYQREDFRHRSLISAVCMGSIVGFGRQGYFLALDALARM